VAFGELAFSWNSELQGSYLAWTTASDESIVEGLGVVLLPRGLRLEPPHRLSPSIIALITPFADGPQRLVVIIALVVIGITRVMGDAVKWRRTWPSSERR